MIAQRISAKLMIDNPDIVDLPAVVPIFHRWIQAQAVEGLLIDVADYRHVPDGPGVLLIGHEGDYAVDMRDGQPGVQYTRKRGWLDNPADDVGEQLRARLRAVLRLAHRAGEVLQSERLPRGRLTVRGDRLELCLLDQLRTPNSVETFTAVRPAVEAVLAEFYPGKNLAVSRAASDPRLPLTIQVQAES